MPCGFLMPWNRSSNTALVNLAWAKSVRFRLRSAFCPFRFSLPTRLVFAACPSLRISVGFRSGLSARIRWHPSAVLSWLAFVWKAIRIGALEYSFVLGLSFKGLKGIIFIVFALAPHNLWSEDAGLFLLVQYSRLCSRLIQAALPKILSSLMYNHKSCTADLKQCILVEMFKPT